MDVIRLFLLSGLLPTALLLAGLLAALLLLLAGLLVLLTGLVLFLFVVHLVHPWLP